MTAMVLSTTKRAKEHRPLIGAVKNQTKASDTKGVINSTVQTISVVGKTLYATDGTSKTITASDIPKITKFLVKPTTTETAVYVDDIVIGIGRRFEKIG